MSYNAGIAAPKGWQQEYMCQEYRRMTIDRTTDNYRGSETNSDIQKD